MQQGTPEWRAQRVGKITGSRIGAMLGVDPNRTQKQLIREMVREYHGAPSEFEENPATLFGKHHEQAARLAFMRSNGQMVHECGYFAHSEDVGASPDGITDDDAVFEAKCLFGQYKKKEPVFVSIHDESKQHYMLQLQLEMLSARKQRAYFFQYVPAFRDVMHPEYIPEAFTTEIVEIDELYIFEALQRARTEFMPLYLSELDNKEHLEPLRVTLDDPRSIATLNRILELDADIETAQEERKHLLDRLIEAAGNKNAEISGHKLTRVERKGSVKYQDIIKQHLPDIDVEQYRGAPSVSWRLT